MSHFSLIGWEIGRTRSRGQPIQTTHSANDAFRQIRMPVLRKRAAPLWRRVLVVALASSELVEVRGYRSAFDVPFALPKLMVPHPGFERPGAAADQCCGLVRNEF
jgi:hypothetical protein